jgi:hypothetical protein
VCDVIGGQRVPLREVLPELIRQTNAHYAIVSGGLDARGLILPLPAQGPIVTFRPLADDVVPNLVDFGLTLGDVEAL